ncbi:DinB family protein [Acidobacterium sp. S8]|uniref:DinB family protein n=1 Tax=Acidobacterium sp. S8 TaxID=1641854 RepID=UPI00131D1724|nr:DinB family protein [Acidobacterium sp. S8]
MVAEQEAVMTRSPRVQNQLGRSAVRMFAANDRMNQMLIEHLDPAAWRAKPPGKVRPIAAIFTHMHNVRCKWVRLTAPHLKVPALLNRAHCTPEEVRAGLAESAARCVEMLAEAFGDGEGRIEEFRRDGWAPAWPVGVEMLCYMLAHEAHHRGQVLMLAHQLGFSLEYEVADGIWNWEKLWRECGADGGPGS